MVATERARCERTIMMVKLSWGVAATGVLVTALVVALGFYLSYNHLNEYFKGVATNTGAGFFDVLLVVVAFGGYEQLRHRNDSIARLRERIGDVKRFDDPRAHSILGAAIRGLAKFGLTDIDLRGARLTAFSFPNNGIRSISGAFISDGFHVHDEMNNFAKLCSVDFSDVNCNSVCFGSSNLSLSTLVNCNFRGATLVGARFDGVSLQWSREGVVVDEDGWRQYGNECEDDTQNYAAYAPAFDKADLTSCSFSGACFQNADFRGARNIGKANFDGAKGLDTCHFDSGQEPQPLQKPRAL